MLTISWAYVGPRAPNGQLPTCFPQSCPEIGYFAILAVVGFFVTLWGGAETLLGFLVRGRYIQPQLGPIQPPMAGSGPEDERILSMARELQSQVKRPKWGVIDGLAWSEGLPWYWVSFTRKGLRKPTSLVLYADLRGKLSAEEWRAVLTYYFLKLKIGGRLVPETIGLLIGPAMLLILGELLTSLTYGARGSALYGQFVGGPGALIVLIIIFPTSRRLHLRQDKIVARSMSQEALLNVFKKIDQLQLPQIENAKSRHGWIARLWPMPNIAERIKYLKKNSGGGMRNGS